VRRPSERPNKSSRRPESRNDVVAVSEVPTNTSDSPSLPTSRVLVPPDWLHRAACSALHELPAWLAALPLQDVADANYPKLVVSGAWDVAASEQLPTTAAALRLVAREVATTIGAEWREVPGAAHDVHREQPKVLNSMLDDLWSRSGKPSSPGR
jgi:pimeloyl-ACP methyl ester carboxylesterase